MVTVPIRLSTKKYRIFLVREIAKSRFPLISIYLSTQSRREYAHAATYGTKYSRYSLRSLVLIFRHREINLLRVHHMQMRIEFFKIHKDAPR